MTQTEALERDYRTLTDNQKLLVISEELDSIADRIAMMIDDAEFENRDTVVTEKLLKKVRKVADYFYQYAEFNEIYSKSFDAEM